MFLLLLFSLSNFSAHAARFDLSYKPDGDHSYVIEHGRFLSKHSTFQNIGAASIETPFNIGFFIFPLLNVLEQNKNCRDMIQSQTLPSKKSYEVGFDWASGLNLSAQITGRLSHVDLSETVPLLTGEKPPFGWYCLWSFANFTARFQELNTDDNIYIFEKPFCYGGNCIDSNLFLYPNPVSSTLYIALPESIEETWGMITVFDSLGRKILEKKEDFSKLRTPALDIQFLSPSTYLISIDTEKNHLTARFVKVGVP